MADKRVFTLEIDGVKQSYDNVVKLYDILNKIKDVHAKVSVETDKVSKSTADSTNKTKEKTKALTDEEKAEKKLEQTLTRRRQLDTQIAREQINANQALRERTQQLQRSIQLENASSGSIDEKRLQLAALGGAYRSLSEEERNAEHIGGTMLKQIQELRAEYNQLERSLGNHAVNVGNYESATAGLVGTLNTLGEGINKTAENTKGMLSLFQAGAGIIALFGKESDTTSKILIQVGKILTIVNALQQANNILLTKGALASKGAAIMEGIHAVQVRARASAIALSTKNTVAATVAQAAFNIVAKANPYVLLAMALITVIGALAAFAIGTDSAAEKQKQMNDAVEKSIDLKDRYASKLQSLSAANINQMQRELDLMKAQGASEARISQKQRQINEERLKQARKMATYYKDEIDSIDENSKKVDRFTKELIQLDRLLYDGKIKNMEAYNTKRDKILQQMDIANRRLSQGLAAREDLQKAENDLDKFHAETSKKGAEYGKKNALALAEYRVLLAQKGSKEELEAQIVAANQRLKNDLSNAEITKGERLKRTQETLLEIDKLEADYRKAQLQDSIALIDARLSLTEKGTLEEFNLQIARLEEQKKIDLENKELTDNQKLQIENKYIADVKKITDDYIKTVSENEINTSIATINARLASVKAGSQEELELRIDLAEENARLAKENIENTIQDEALKAAKIKEINENLQKEIRELSSESEVSQIEALASQETLVITKEYEKRKISKQAYEEQMLNLSIDSLVKEIDIRKRYGEDTTDLEIELSERRIEQAEFEKNKVSEYFKQLHETLQKYVDGVMTSLTAIFDATNSVLQSQLDDANEKFEAISQKYDEVVEKREESDSRLQELEEEVKNARGGRALILQEQINSEMIANQQLANQEKQLAKEKEKQEKEIAKKEKQMKKVELTQNIVQGIANTALGVTKALEWGFPLGPVFAAVIGAAGAVQVGVMTSQLAKLEDGGLLNGKRHSQGGMRVEGTNIEVEGGEYVVNRDSTNKNLGLIKYINSQRRTLGPNDLSSFFSKSSQGFEPPFKRMFETGGQLPAIENTVSIDNEALVDAIQGIKIEPKVSVTDINDAQNDVVKVDNWTGL
nr:MAG TPA: chromosome segregation ATPase [Caudoviricetes sp.]